MPARPRILLVIVSWAGLTWFGFALVYLPQLPSSFDFGQTPASSPHTGIVEAMSFSIGALISLSEGSYAKVHWLQLVRGGEAVMALVC